MKSNYFLPFLFCFLCLGCEDTLSCIIPREPELPNKSFPVTAVDSYFYTSLKAEINNEPRDDDYDYYFDVKGLPLGMEYVVDYRTVKLQGIPEVAGTYRITVDLYVDVLEISQMSPKYYAVIAPQKVIC
ncbi:hypothetical protein HNV08_14155 [Winogradskyella eckloniae]|uniref:hypothetical protein n=1 Tax=Winogradskyella eckloniae TaxID=1089306 RepID=UPI0015668364|nr:hypothetical protein [Winogradskyella eckloniae]NRD21197.1 hypothetical protein [Winogradskyella eckloniae]